MNIQKTRYLSFLGLVIFIVGLAIAGFNNNLFIHLIGLSITIIGWLVFSNYHTKIAIYNLKKITGEYIESIKNDSINKQNKGKKKK